MCKTSLSKTQNILFLESRCYVKAIRRLPQASSLFCLHRFIINICISLKSRNTFCSQNRFNSGTSCALLSYA